MSHTKFYAELGNENGGTNKPKAVVEARIDLVNDREYLVPVAPQLFAKHWPNGWYRGNFGGWVEVDGPARALTHVGWKALIDNIPSEIKEKALKGAVTLKNGQILPISTFNTTMKSINFLKETKPIVLIELFRLCQDLYYELLEGSDKVLLRERLIVKTHAGLIVPTAVSSIIFSMVEGRGIDMKFGDPIAR